MLFSDHLGRTEEQIKREIEDRGGARNGVTSADTTMYYVHIGKEHGPLALEWLYRIVSPHAMDPEIVKRQRDPVALEIGARPRQLLDWLWALYVDPAWLRLAGFWESEFGLETRDARDYYPYRSLRRITPADLRSFYETYYVPSRMTLTVIGDIERERVREIVDATFATLPERPIPELPDTLRDPGRYYREISWEHRSDVSYGRYFKLYRPTARERLLLQFVSRYLDRRLDARLRYGERKASYGFAVRPVLRGPAAYLGISGTIKDTEFEFARDAIQEEIDLLRLGTVAPDAFVAERDAVARYWRMRGASAEGLGDWASDAFYERGIHEDFPDLVGLAEGLTLEEVQAFAAATFVPRREYAEIVYRHPLSEGTLALAALGLFFLTVRLARRALVRPVDMTRVRYVGRLRLPWVHKLVTIPAAVLLVAALGRLLAQALLALAVRFLFPVQSFAVQWLVLAGMLVLATLSIVLVLSLFPRKLLVFDDHVRIKYFAYRSRSWPLSEIAELSLRRFRDVRAVLFGGRVVPLAFGVYGPAVYLRPTHGRAWLFRVLRPEQLVALVERLR